MIRRGEIWWATLPDPKGAEPGYRRPVLVVQCDDFNRSTLRTVLVVALTSNVTRSGAPGNVLLPRKVTGLPAPSVANVTQVVTADRTFLTERVGAMPQREMLRVEAGLRLVLAL